MTKSTWSLNARQAPHSWQLSIISYADLVASCPIRHVAAERVTK